MYRSISGGGSLTSKEKNSGGCSGEKIRAGNTANKKKGEQEEKGKEIHVMLHGTTARKENTLGCEAARKMTGKRKTTNSHCVGVAIDRKQEKKKRECVQRRRTSKRRQREKFIVEKLHRPLLEHNTHQVFLSWAGQKLRKATNNKRRSLRASYASPSTQGTTCGPFKRFVEFINNRIRR